MSAYEQIALELGISIPEEPTAKPKTLKGCPFCGRPIEVVKGGSIHCSKCRALIIIAGTPQNIVEIWNTRRKLKC